MEDNGRATTSFMRQLKKMFEEVPEIVWWDRGAIVIGDRDALEGVLPRYYRTCKFSSFQRQLNNFGYHRSYDRGNNWRGVCYCKVVGAPASEDVEDLLSLRPLVRRKKREPIARKRLLCVDKAFDKVARYRQQHYLADDGLQQPDEVALAGVNDALAHAARCLLAMNELRA
ncbi:hypothetical protein CTAYLR_005912 [Chrysophaeum taylorii]|uniref:HSF-type DNA-binding domain-containing protein n=1 Tax=Chrysophaeum taylorii TaxID=2483200 RepID=A0AAD7UN33_9STRA|nr:hypothetical protein CTAYLR_005886 [Chrysophaeum taylorii]KAJ8611728.1 hypothetical protein CTAYLR_009201 [Chrysophaeum taylorii]KAJ8614334.1 hypothetical protein CTAYLR_005912 [Chrysophaeum taylorii]